MLKLLTVYPLKNQFSFKIRLFLAIGLTLVFLGLGSSAFAKETEIQSSKPKEVDARVLILKYYLANYNSPLQNSAESMVRAADKYNLDWKLLPSIAGVESTFGLRIPGGHARQSSFNAWGWGVYGEKVTKFTSWDQAVEIIARGLKEDYIGRGLLDSYAMNKRYSSSPEWGWKVEYFKSELSAYETNFNQKFGTKIAAHNQMVRNIKDQENQKIEPIELSAHSNMLSLR